MKYVSKSQRKILRRGSKSVKNQLMQTNPCCDICGKKKKLQLHHIYCVRWGFPTTLDHCVLLCPE